ncbi:unnamed protein product [Calypogeia fissa]
MEVGGGGGADWSEAERNSYPGAGRRTKTETSNLEEILKAKPAPLPVVAILLIVLWLWVPFIVSVVFLAIILGIFGAADYQDHYKIPQPVDDMNSFLSNVMLKREHAASIIPEPEPAAG